jgi:hypothetical protein
VQPLKAIVHVAGKRYGDVQHCDRCDVSLAQLSPHSPGFPPGHRIAVITYTNHGDRYLYDKEYGAGGERWIHPRLGDIEEVECG